MSGTVNNERGKAMKKILVCALSSALCAATALGGFTKSVAFTTSGYQGSGPLADFPVLVRLSTAIDGFDYADFGGTTNLVFKDSGGSAIPHEVDTWNTSGTSLIWVRVPSVTSATTFRMYYCGEDAAANNPATVWTSANYVGVWHMDEESGTVADATGHGLTATPMGTDTSKSNRYNGSDAPVGYARRTGTGSSASYLSVGSYDSFNVGNTFTISCWLRLTGLGSSPRIFSRKVGYKDSDGWEIELSGFGQFKARGAGQDKDKCTGSITPDAHNNWVHLAFVYDGSTLVAYTNGNFSVRSDSITAATDNDKSFSIGSISGGGSNCADGSFDECRLLDDVASADWIAAEFATVASDTFVVAGAVESAQRSDGMMIFVF
jgi:hypothetical protein